MEDDTTVSEADIVQLKAEVLEQLSRLSPLETSWRDRYKLLERHGYRLRARYHPDWVPSWRDTPGVKPKLCDDYHPSIVCAPLLAFHAANHHAESNSFD